jgi:DNA polymerase-3 subunit beta
VSADEENPVEVAITDGRNQILFQLSDIDLVSQLIDGNFPDYDKIMPHDHTTRAVINTKALQNAARIASFFARDAANVVRLELRPGDELQPGIVVVSAQAAEVGGNQTELEASIEGEPVEIAFNAKYLVDVLGVIGSDQVALELTTPSSPGLFRPVDDTPFIHVIMPMHIGR